jgi:hypothetical protein
VCTVERSPVVLAPEIKLRHRVVVRRELPLALIQPRLRLLRVGRVGELVDQQLEVARSLLGLRLVALPDRNLLELAHPRLVHRLGHGAVRGVGLDELLVLPLGFQVLPVVEIGLRDLKLRLQGVIRLGEVVDDLLEGGDRFLGVHDVPEQEGAVRLELLEAALVQLVRGEQAFHLLVRVPVAAPRERQRAHGERADHRARDANRAPHGSSCFRPEIIG